MISDGMAEVLRSLRLLGEGGDPGAACARALGVPGVTVTLLVKAGQGAEPLWCHPELSGRFEDLQFTLGEGPAPDALRGGVPVLEPDLRLVPPERWPALLPSARELGVLGVNCFPLGIGAVRLGVLTILCEGKPLSDQQYADATALAAALTSAALSGDPVDGSNGLRRAAVHQATGMISVQLEVPLSQALLRLRAHAFGTGRPLGEVAADVVARRIRFHPEGEDRDDDAGGDMSGPDSPGDIGDISPEDRRE
ncbi:ANTAR domain-containing protein [Streptomyces sp. NPDC051684]|uniref:ANTAR domain-containing protein n=1 Tax=Streptomyces sp. NPDC051684 TaxID=3365670 RepID=UPI0037B6489B